MKLKSRQRNSLHETIHRRYRRLSMLQSPSTIPTPGDHAADAAHKRCETWKFFRRLNKLQRKPLSYTVLQQLGLAD